MLSFAAVGGGVVMLAPDIHRYVVDVHRWISDEQFTAAYALAQAAPGPNMLFITLVGWQIAGWAGALAATVAVAVPPAILAYVVTSVAAARGDGTGGRIGRFGRAVRNGLAPLTVGLLFASVWVLFGSTHAGWREGAAVLAGAAVMLKTRINPLWLIAAGAAAGIAGLVGGAAMRRLPTRNRMPFRRTAALALATVATSLALAACSSAPPNPNPRAEMPLKLAQVDLPRYMGKWYIVANIPYFLEKDLVGSHTVYTLRDDGKVVENFIARKKNFDGDEKNYEFVDTPDPATGNARWSVRLFWPIYTSQETLYVDDAYEYTLIGYKDKSLGWIFARKPEMSDAKYRELLAKFDEQGYDTSRFRRVPQKREEMGKPGFNTPEQ